MNEIKKMSWEKLLPNNRLGKKNDLDNEPGRTPFHKDYDRIIFSGSFRRLSKKTQVHPLANNDHLHNRLSHSLEVACVGRSLGMLVGEKLNKQFPSNIGMGSDQANRPENSTNYSKLQAVLGPVSHFSASKRALWDLVPSQVWKDSIPPISMPA